MWPHGVCLLWNKSLLAWTVLSNAVIAVSYFAIPVMLVTFARRYNVRFRSIYLMFSVFTLLCGFTHVMDVVVLWTPLYRLQAMVVALTAAASVGTLAAIVGVAKNFTGLLDELNAIRAQAEEKL